MSVVIVLCDVFVVLVYCLHFFFFFFSSRRRHTRWTGDWSSDVCSSDLGMRATISDWANHLSSIFPEVRLKRYLEMRGADSGTLPNLLALPALWAGLLYEIGRASCRERV